MISNKSPEVQAAFTEIDAIFKKYGLNGAVMFVNADIVDDTKFSTAGGVCFAALDPRIISYNEDGITLEATDDSIMPRQEMADKSTTAYVTMGLVCAACASLATNLMNVMQQLVPDKDPMVLLTMLSNMQEPPPPSNKSVKPDHYGFY